MSPSLEPIMFNRNANLSGRRLLLDERPPAVIPRETNRYYAHDVYYPQPQDCRRQPYLKPSNVELEKRLQDIKHRGKVGYFDNKATTPEHELDRREAELVFRFDPSGEYVPNPYQVSSVQYNKWPSPPRVPDRNGPFVFGVHSPSDFRVPNQDDEEDYDYSEVADENCNGRTMVCDSESNGTYYCDKMKEWTGRDHTKGIKPLRRFEIKDRRKGKSGSRKEKIKCVLIGDGAVGKTSLITAYAQDEFRDDYQPTAFDTFNVEVDVDDRAISVEICDTAGQDSMKELRELCYPGTDVLMLCFSVVRPETFRSVAERWASAAALVNAPVILVGTQSDLVHDARILDNLRRRGEHVVTEAEALALAIKINAVYMETSAKTRTKLKDAFDSAILAALPVVKTKKPFWKKIFCVN